ncbi:hypothetical protein [Methanobacterium spitsbergense]|uniref:Myb-like domain-containing protein n=1 Tax=Methanobacterium spitsbergense TaxID=2874285 RepID=A0A8T5UYV6_9EURY|nr:hypothetical protein [Methanobacterium spitsbergense]MBZ2166350.1 hypothetical protein [Methanobacterium spitsbergense]
MNTDSSGKHWSEDEDNLLIELKGIGLKAPQIRKEHLPLRSESAINSRASILGVTHANIWSNKDLWTAWIMNKKGFGTQEIADELGRTKRATSTKMSCKGLFYRPPHSEPPIELKREVMELLRADSK